MKNFKIQEVNNGYVLEMEDNAKIVKRVFKYLDEGSLLEYIGEELIGKKIVVKEK